MIKVPKWIKEEIVYAVHSEQIAEHGGLSGIRDAGLITSTITAPQQAFHYQRINIDEIAAIYAYRLCNNHPFTDGNKRTAYVISRLFLLLNQYDLQASAEERIQVFFEIADNIISEADLKVWYKNHCNKMA